MTIEQSVDEREAAALAGVTARLRVKLPAVDPAEIETVVLRCFGGFAGSKIRDFVPILVERAAYAELSRPS